MATKSGDNSRREVKLSGEELKRFKIAEDAAFKHLEELAALILEKMEGSSKRLASLKGGRFTFGVHGAHVLCVTDGEGNCACFDSQVGICRPCLPEELSSH
jgi:hypothetical protein